MVGYKDVCASSSPEKFISGISAVAIQAKRTRASLQLLLQLNHVTIEAARDLLFEARGLEAIFVASRNTAKRRHRARLGGAGTGGFAEKSLGARRVGADIPRRNPS